MLHPNYRDQLVNAVYGNNYYLFWELDETYKYIMCTVQSFFLMLKQVVRVMTTVSKGLTICTDFHDNVF
jgi:hypothetical protein